MGQATDAILAFGFNLIDAHDDEGALPRMLGEPHNEEGFEFDDWLTKKAGLFMPSHVYVRHGVYTPEYLAYREQREAAIAACPVQMVEHCHRDAPMIFLALRGMVKRASRGRPAAVLPYQPNGQQLGDAMAWCEAKGVMWREPAWHIFSYWG